MRKQGAIYLPSFSFYPIPRTRLTALALTALLSVEKYLLLYFNYSIIWSQPLRGRCACLITLIREKRKEREMDSQREAGGIVVVVLCCLFRRFFVFCLTKKRDISLGGSRRDEKCRESVSGFRFLLFIIGKQLFFVECVKVCCSYMQIRYSRR